MNEILQHHGIKGQKWGVRRYQNPDGTLTQAGRKRLGVSKRATYITKERKANQDKWRRKAIKQHSGKDTPKFTNTSELNPDEEYTKKKGEYVTHLTTRNKVTPQDNGVLYVSADDQDRQLYKSVLAARIMKHTKQKSINDIEIQLKNDLKAPSRNESISIFKEMYDNNKEVKKYLEDKADYIVNFLKEDGEDPKVIKEWTNVRDQIKTGKKSAIENHGYRIFNHDFTEHGITDNPIFKEYIDTVKSKGYNALIDDNDSKYDHMGAKCPIVILDEINVIGKMTVKEIKADSVYSEYMKWLDKEMKNNK